MSEIIKLYFVEKFSEGDKDRQLDAMREYFQFVPLGEAEAIYCASIVTMEQAMSAKHQSGLPVAVYCWDYYLFAHDGRHKGWDWKLYASFLVTADVVFVPSRAQQRRLKELLNLDSIVVRSGVLTYEHEVTDAGFILDPIRYYPDEQAHWPEKAAKELGIPIIHSEHQYSEEEFRKLVASCTFMTCAVPEASTGGLSLAEGLWLGKKTLVSNSPYNGAKDYLRNYAMYFRYDDYGEFKRKMLFMWNTRIKAGRTSVRYYMERFLSFDAMAKGLHAGISMIILNKK